jgi:hypothetical protein
VVRRHRQILRIIVIIITAAAVPTTRHTRARIHFPHRSLHKTSHCSALLIPPSESDEKEKTQRSPWQDNFILHVGKEVPHHTPPPRRLFLSFDDVA